MVLDDDDVAVVVERAWRHRLIALASVAVGSLDARAIRALASLRQSSDLRLLPRNAPAFRGDRIGDQEQVAVCPRWSAGTNR